MKRLELIYADSAELIIKQQWQASILEWRQEIELSLEE